jgi:hypothetical protein
MEDAMADILGGKFALWDSGLSFEEFKAAVGFAAWAEIDEKYAT